ncbi:MAG: DUF4332 domain-containing protein [Planctomycetota bacterium]
MSNSSASQAPMRLASLHLVGEGTWPDLELEKLGSHLNLVYGSPRTGKSSLAQLIGHLLFGKTDTPWRRQFGQSVASTAGSVTMSGPVGEFVLRRQYDANRHPRLSITSQQGDAVDSDTISNLLSGLSPQNAATVFHVDFAESPRADWLLSDAFSRELATPQYAKTRQDDPSQLYSRCNLNSLSTSQQVDGQRVDELVKRRDSIAGEIQQQMATRRSESEVLEREVGEIDSARVAKRGQLEQLRAQLHALDDEIASLETWLRYHSLDEHAKHGASTLNVDANGHKLAELDEEIASSRTSISETQRREQSLRTELAQYGADGTADSVTCLTDGRATIGVLEKLLDDLDVEVAQLARAHEPGRCVGHDSHAKITPVAALLRQQVYTLCGQITEQERIVRRQQLQTELRQLARVQAELGERLDLLLTQREALVQQSQVADQVSRLIPQPPVVDHCQCEHHGDFVQVADAMVLGRADRRRHQTDTSDQLQSLQRQRQQLLADYDVLQRDLQELDTRWEQRQDERAGLISGASIEKLQAELDRLEAAIRQSLAAGEYRATNSSPTNWRASDILAQLTDGNLTQIRIDRQQSKPTIVDRRGHVRSLDSLSATEHDQLYLALTLALVSSYAQRGIVLPLVLDEPFLNLNSAQAATMLGVLDEFASDSHQLFVFTEDHDIYRRYGTLSGHSYDLDSLRKTITPVAAAPLVAPPTPTTVQTATTRIVRQSYGSESAPALRLAPIEGDSSYDDEFYLTESSSFVDFPLLGADTGRLFGLIGLSTIGDLLAASADTVAAQLTRDGISADTVELWQIHMALMCHVPNLTLDDAQVLAAIGVNSPAELFDTDIDRLLDEIAGFLRSEHGQRFARLGNRFTRTRLSGWRDGARRYRDRWHQSQHLYLWTGGRSRRSSRTLDSRSRDKSISRRKTSSARTNPTPTKTIRSKKFYLNRHEDVEAAPSIGPKTASRLAKVGIRTVADLLNADPDSTATELDVSHINAETLAEWQHQARLVCQIPGLRGYGAQLLVACGLTQPEQIAGTQPDQLVTQVLAYCETKEGQRILRSGDPPKVEKIAEWVSLAADSRPLEAA